MNWKIKIIQRLLKNDEFLLIRMDKANGESGVLSYFSKDEDKNIEMDEEKYSVMDMLAETIARTIEDCPERAVGEVFLDGVARYLKHREIATRDFLKRIE